MQHSRIIVSFVLLTFLVSCGPLPPPNQANGPGVHKRGHTGAYGFDDPRQATKAKNSSTKYFNGGKQKINQLNNPHNPFKKNKK